MKKPVTRKRLDLILVERDLVDSRQQAQRLIMAGQVMVDGRVVDKPGTRILQEADITLQATLPYVSRGGLKLEAALDRFAIEVTGMIAADVGASTGGLTDCPPQRGASQNGKTPRKGRG